VQKFDKIGFASDKNYLVNSHSQPQNPRLGLARQFLSLNLSRFSYKFFTCAV